jgi:hypothetical protein
MLVTAIRILAIERFRFADIGEFSSAEILVGHDLEHPGCI